MSKIFHNTSLIHTDSKLSVTASSLRTSASNEYVSKVVPVTTTPVVLDIPSTLNPYSIFLKNTSAGIAYVGLDGVSFPFQMRQDEFMTVNMNFGYNTGRFETSGVTCVADVSGSLNGKYFTLFDSSGEVRVSVETAATKAAKLALGSDTYFQSTEIVLASTDDIGGTYFDVYDAAGPVRFWVNLDSRSVAPPMPPGGRRVSIALATNEEAAATTSDLTKFSFTWSLSTGTYVGRGAVTLYDAYGDPLTVYCDVGDSYPAPTVTGPSVLATELVAGRTYMVLTAGTTPIGAPVLATDLVGGQMYKVIDAGDTPGWTVGLVLTATGSETGVGTAGAWTASASWTIGQVVVATGPVTGNGTAIAGSVVSAPYAGDSGRFTILKLLYTTYPNTSSSDTLVTVYNAAGGGYSVSSDPSSTTTTAEFVAKLLDTDLFSSVTVVDGSTAGTDDIITATYALPGPRNAPGFVWNAGSLGARPYGDDSITVLGASETELVDGAIHAMVKTIDALADYTAVQTSKLSFTVSASGARRAFSSKEYDVGYMSLGTGAPTTPLTFSERALAMIVAAVDGDAKFSAGKSATNTVVILQSETGARTDADTPYTSNYTLNALTPVLQTGLTGSVRYIYPVIADNATASTVAAAIRAEVALDASFDTAGTGAEVRIVDSATGYRSPISAGTLGFDVATIAAGGTNNTLWIKSASTSSVTIAAFPA